jgi:hypothetical protein
MPQIGPTFGAELAAAGLAGLPFAWNAAGEFTYDPAITPEQQTAIEAVLAAHDHTKAVIPLISKRQMLTWLLQNKNKTDADVLAALDTIADSAAKAQAQIDYLYPDGPFHRANPLFDQLGAEFAMSSAEIDAAFVAAAQL